MPFIHNAFHHSPSAQVRPRPSAVSGEYCCLGCGYRIVGRGELRTCPMCHRQAWRLVAWRPFSVPAHSPDTCESPSGSPLGP